MSGKLQPATSPFEQVAELLLRLQALRNEGRSETPEADALRLAMNAPWAELSEEEMDLLDGLSADLYMLSGEELPPRVPAAQRRGEVLAEHYEDARSRGDDAAVLDVLRRSVGVLPSEHLAFLRASAYGRLGLRQVALVYYEHAYKLSQDPEYLYYIGLTYLESGREAEAVQLAQRLASDEAQSLFHLLSVGQIMLYAGGRHYPGTPPDAAAIAVKAFRLLLASLDGAAPSSLTADFAKVARLGIAASLGLLGDAEGARSEYDRLLAQDPGDELVRAARTALHDKLDAQEATRRFAEMAARLGDRMADLQRAA